MHFKISFLLLVLVLIGLQSVSAQIPSDYTLTCSNVDFDCDGRISTNDAEVIGQIWRNGTELDTAFVTAKAAECQPLGEYLGYLLRNDLTEITLSESTRVATEIVQLQDICQENITVELGEAFSLWLYQNAIVENENLEMRLDNSVVAYCQGTGCVDVIPTVYLTVIKHGSGNVVTSESSDTETSVATEIRLGLNEETSVFGYTIQNNSIAPEKASFIITKDTTEDYIEVSLGQEFSLRQRQTANIMKNNLNIAKMTLEKIIEQPVYCIRAPCPPRKTAFLSFSSSNGKIVSFSIGKNQTQEVLGKYTVKLLDLSSSAGTFIVDEIDIPEEPILSVLLDEEFDLLQRQTAQIRETGFKITFLEYKQQEAVCHTSVTSEGFEIPCDATPETYGVFLVEQGYSIEKLSDTKLEETKEGGTIKWPSSKRILIREGSYTKIFGHVINLQSIAIPYKDIPEEPTLRPKATLTVSLIEEPNVINAWLDRKFELNIEQTARVMDKSGETVMKLLLEDIDYYKCALKDDSYATIAEKCDSRPFARVAVSLASGGTRFFNLREGSEKQVGGYTVRLVDIEKNLRQAVFVVSQTGGGDYKVVFLNRKFELNPKQTALVKEIDLFMRLNNIAMNKTNPPEFVALISVWRNHRIYDIDEEVTVTQEGGSDQAVSGGSDQTAEIAEYKIRLGETIKLYGAKISLVDISSLQAVFVVSHPNDPGVINVHIEEPFWLKENQAARVLRANMQIDLMDVRYKEYCRPIGETKDFNVTTDSNVTTLPCEFLREVDISVSNYLFEKETVGRTISIDAVQKVVTEDFITVDSTTGSIAVTDERAYIPLPPRPFNVYTLREGESVTVNDFLIKVLSIEHGRAEFIVKSKLSGHTITYNIYNGWNLFSMPGQLEVEQSDCEISQWRIFEYDAQNNRFKAIKKPKVGIAYWVYNRGTHCKVGADIRKPISINRLHPLFKGWNFVPTTLDMIGTPINKFGNCEIRGVFSWNAKEQKWVKRLNDPVNRTDLGKGFAVFSKNKCKLGKDTENPLVPPPVPVIEEERPSPLQERPSINDDAVLNQSCGIGEPCPIGYGCYTFTQAGIENPVCIREPACLQVTCPSGSCSAMESYPAKLFCGRP